MRSIYSLNQIFMSVGMIFTRRSPECSVASGRAHRLAYGVTTSLCRVFSFLFSLTIPSFSSMTGLLTCLHNSQPGYCLQRPICPYELYFLSLFFPPCHGPESPSASSANGNKPSVSRAPLQAAESRATCPVSYLGPQ